MDITIYQHMLLLMTITHAATYHIVYYANHLILLLLLLTVSIDTTIGTDKTV